MVTAKKSSDSESSSRPVGSKKLEKLATPDADQTQLDQLGADASNVATQNTTTPQPADGNAKTAINPNVPWPFPSSSV
jgi:hypothetical protein